MSAYTSHPLATESGLRAFSTILALQDIWYRLTKAQRNALLMRGSQRGSAHPRVLANLRGKALIAGEHHMLTPLGGAVVEMRPGKTT